MYFNPGQQFQFLAWLQQWPWALFAQDVASCVLQAAAYAGLILFALRAPASDGRAVAPRLRALPALALVFLAVELMSLGSLFGFRTEIAMRAALIMGFLVGGAALAILIGRRGDLSPRDYQRVRWVIWGCLIGLPAYLVAELWQWTSLPTAFSRRLGHGRPRRLPLSGQRGPLPVRRRGGASVDRGQRPGAAAPRELLGPSAACRLPDP